MLTSDVAVSIRRETPDDHDAIERVVSRAFASQTEAQLVESIRTSAEYIAETALVATVDDNVVGHVMISAAVLRGDDVDRRIVMLSPLAVEPDSQGLGIGGALVRAVTAVADELGEPLVILEGSPAYYPRFGFEHSVALGIEIPLPDWAPSEAGQVLRLANYDPDLRGRVVYPTAFDDL